MNEFARILKNHAARYPLMQPVDAVKLVYQSVFGPGHLIKSEKAASKRLEAEYASISHTASFRIETLGDTARVYLDAPLSEDDRDLITRMFCASAKHFPRGWNEAGQDARARLGQRIGCLRALTVRGCFAFDLPTLDAYLRAWKKDGCPAVSHSEAYHAAYSPAYRVIDSRFARIFDAAAAIVMLKASLPRVVAAIDGRCASGKSTTADMLAELFPAASIIRMDDFFLPPELRTPERLEEIGGNLHRERFITEVLPYLRRNKTFRHRVFDCAVFDFAKKPRRIKPKPIMIVEGSYALHPDFGQYYDLSLFSDIASEEQLRRIRERDGEDMLAMFRDRWIPMEERYFGGFDIRARCDLILK